MMGNSLLAGLFLILFGGVPQKNICFAEEIYEALES